jgi:hypothetical protein
LWYREFKLYMAPFPERIQAGARKALRQRSRTSADHSGALASLAVLGQHSPEETLALFLNSRSAWIRKALKRIPPHPSSKQQGNNNGGSTAGMAGEGAAEAAWARTVQTKLRTSLRTLRRTVTDARCLFVVDTASAAVAAPSSLGNDEGSAGSSELLVAALVSALLAKANDDNDHGTQQQPQLSSSSSFLAASLVTERCTAWVAKEVKRVLSVSQPTLALASTAGVLAFIRQGLWAEATQSSASSASAAPTAAGAACGGTGAAGAAFSSASSPPSSPSGVETKATELPTTTTAADNDRSSSSWALDCAACLNGTKLAAALKGSGVRLDHLLSLKTGSSSSSSSNGFLHPNNGAAGGSGLDLWSLLFSRSFSELGEGLLRSSLWEIRTDVQGKLSGLLTVLVGHDPIAAAAAATGESAPPSFSSSFSRNGCGGGSGTAQRDKSLTLASLATAAAASSSATSLSWHGRPAGRPASEVALCAEKVADLLEGKLGMLSKDANSLVQHGDTHAAHELAKSLHLRSVEMAAGFANHLRVTAEALVSVTSEALKEAIKLGDAADAFDDSAAAAAAASSSAASSHSLARATRVPATPAEVQRQQQEQQEQREKLQARQQFLVLATRSLDGLLVVARLCRALQSGASALRQLLAVPPALAVPSPDCISIEQLQAAFIVTDNDGDGQLDQSEASEAIGSVLGCGHLLSLASSAPSLPTITLPEFSLLCTAILEQPTPLAHFSEALDGVFALAHEHWAKASVREARKALSREITQLATSAGRVTSSSSSVSAVVGSAGAFTSVPAENSEEAWREEHGTWAQYPSSSSSSSSGDGLDEQQQPPLVVPADLSAPLHRFLFTAATEMKQVVGSSDFCGADPDQLISGSPNSGGGASGGGGCGSREGGGVAHEVRAVFMGEALEALCGSYHELSLHVATMDGCAEAAVLALLVDAMFLKGWTASASAAAAAATSSSSSSSGSGNEQQQQPLSSSLARAAKRLEAVEQSLAMYVDPINLQLFKPHLRATCRKAHDASHHVLGLLLPIPSAAAATAWGTAAAPVLASSAQEKQAAVGGGDGPGKGGEGSTADEPRSDYLHSTTNLLPLARPVRRFTLLPLPLDAIQLSVASGSGGVGGGADGGSALGGAEGSAGYASPEQLRRLGQQGTGKYGESGRDGATGGFLSNLRFKW